MTLTITANWAEVDANLQTYVVNLEEQTAGIISDIVLFGEGVAKRAAPKDTSGLARAIVSEARGLVGSVSVPGGGAAVAPGQAITQEFGRRPGSRMPPPEALRGWATRHGFDLSKGGGKGVLFVLARSIGRKGYPGVHYMDQARQAMIRALPGIVEARGGRILER